MNKKKISLVDLGTGTNRSLIPLGIGLIKSYALNDLDLKFKFDIDLVILGNNNLNYVHDRVKNSQYIGFACYVWNLLGCSEISARIKREHPETIIIWGGPSIPQTSQRIKEFAELNPYVDYFVYGEGERAFAELIKDLENDKKNIKAKSVFMLSKSGDVIINPPEPRLTNLDVIPSPYLAGYFDDLLIEHKDHIVGALWETSRGCPFKCSFCDWGSALVNKVNRFSIDRAVAEIRWISHNKLDYVYATDANFGITYDRDIDIAKQFAQISRRTGFPSTLVLNWTKNSSSKIVEIASEFKSGGVSTNVTLSYQSHNEETLKAIQRKNIKFDDYFKLKSEFHDKDLPTYTELILGLPYETLQTFIYGVEKTISVKVQDQISIYLAIVLENTELQAKIENFEIETRKCPVGLNRRLTKFERFGEEDIIVATATMSNSDWRKCYKFTYLFLSLYNLRLLFYPLAYLKENLNQQVTQFILYVLDLVELEPKHYILYGQAVKHLERNIDSIMSNQASVLNIEGSDEYKFQPHEALTLMFLDAFEDFYSESRELYDKFLKSKQVEVDQITFDDLFKIQKISIPFFDSKSNKVTLNSTFVVDFLKKVVGMELFNDYNSAPISLIADYPTHNFSSEREFNRRRISSGYTMNLPKFNSVTATDKTVPKSRNLHLT